MADSGILFPLILGVTMQQIGLQPESVSVVVDKVLSTRAPKLPLLLLC